MMKIALLLTLLLTFFANAKMIPNTKALEIYHNQLAETQRIFNEVQQTLIVSDAVYNMYKSLGYITPEVIAISRHLLVLEEDSKQLYGDVSLGLTPFVSCSSMASDAYNFWMEKIDGLKKENQEYVNQLGMSYINSGKECLSAINTAPPKEIEDRRNLQIIDVAP